MRRVVGLALSIVVLLQSTVLAMDFKPVERVDPGRDIGVFVTILVIVLSIFAGVVDHIRKNR